MNHDEQPAAQAEPSADTATHDVQQLLEDARSKADEHWNQLLRARADLDNLRRRHERDLESAHKYALERFALELLPVKDSLELGLASGADAGTGADKALREGIEDVYPGDVAREWMERWRDNPKILERELAINGA